MRAPFSHGAAKPAFEEYFKIAWIGVATFLRYCLYGTVRRREEFLYGIQPVAGDHLVYGLSAKLLESQIRKPP